MSKLWRRTIVLFVIAFACWYVGLVITPSDFEVIIVISAVTTSILCVCSFASAIMKRIKPDASKYKIFAWTDGLIGIGVIAYAVYDIMTSTGWFAGLLGMLLLIFVIPVVVLLLIIDFILYIRNKKGKMKKNLIRTVKPGDETILAHIQTESWKAAFRDILAEDVLEKCTDLNRATAMYQTLLEEKKGHGYILEVEGKPHCIAYWDSTREKDMPGYAEIICIHSLQDNWGKGYGGKMMDRLLSDIAAAGYKKVMLWVFVKNERARKFYEAKGFAATDRIQPSFDTEEICYEKSL